ncbi:MAG: serpin family protein [Planctomycetes bacterium]|nr:serpin family protein [Planctomycetota bacterium]
MVKIKETDRTRKVETMKKTTIITFIIALLTVNALAMRPAPQPDDDDMTKINKLIASNNEFAFDMYSRIKDEESNIFFSPYSISTALAMTYAGANGKTASQMGKALHLTQGQNDVHFAFSQLHDHYNKAGKKGNYQLSVANALWGQKGYNFLDDFINITKQKYGAGLNIVDFANQTEKSRKKINTWVEDKTNDKIKNLLPKGTITSLTRLVLTNAIYFKGDWALKFDKKNTKKADFKVSPKKTIKTDMMFMKDKFKFYEDKDLQVIDLPYKGDDLSMMVILPKKAENLAGIEKQLNAEKIKKFSKSLRKRDVMLYLPKFKITWGSFVLNDTLIKMGMKDAFDRNADFSGMNGNKDLYITSVVHKAFVAVDEEGTEAAAATGVVIGLRSIPKTYTFRADHPFVFMIKDNKIGSILFMGRLSNPEAKDSGSTANDDSPKTPSETDKIISLLENADIRAISTKHSQRIHIALKDGTTFYGKYVQPKTGKYSNYSDILNLAMHIQKNRNVKWSIACE